MALRGFWAGGGHGVRVHEIRQKSQKFILKRRLICGWNWKCVVFTTSLPLSTGDIATLMYTRKLHEARALVRCPQLATPMQMQLERLLDQRGPRMIPSPGLQIHLWPRMWPWSLTSWPTKFVLWPCPVNHLCQFASKSFHTIDFQNMFTNLITEERKHGRTDRKDKRPGRNHNAPACQSGVAEA